MTRSSVTGVASVSCWFFALALGIALKAQPIVIETGRATAPSGSAKMTVDQGGRWYFTLPGRHGIAVKAAWQDSARIIEGYGWGAWAFDQPTGIATDGLSVYVADRGNHRIVRLDRDLRPISALFTRDTVATERRFGHPEDVAITSIGDVMIIDGDTQEIVGIRHDRRPAFRAGSVPGPSGLHKSPRVLCVDMADGILVGDGGIIRMYDFSGNPVGMDQISQSQELVGITSTHAGMAAITRDTLYVWHSRDESATAIPRSILSPGNPPREFRDVEWFRGSLYILTGTEIIRYAVTQE